MRELNREAVAYAVEKSITRDIREGNVSGACVLVTQDGKPLLKECYGVADLRTKAPLYENTLFRLASMTKPITAVAALQLVEKGKLSLYDEVKKYLPAFADRKVGKLSADGVVFSHKASGEINIMQLLTHQSGLGSSEAGALQMQKIPLAAKKNLQTVTEYYAENLFLSNSPMECVAYSGVAAFDVVARIVELISDTDFHTYLKENIFRPLGMADTTFLPTEEQWSRMTAMHQKNESGSSSVDLGKTIFGNHPLTYFAGGAGLAGTVSDYGRFAQMLLQNGSLDGVRILKPETLRMMAQGYVPEGTPGLGKVHNWGLGCRVITGEDVLTKGSYGWSGAYGTHFWVDPENKLTAIYMKNSLYDGGSGAKTARQFEIDVMSKEQTDTTEKPLDADTCHALQQGSL